MPKLSTKHPSQEIITLSDFSGGLNFMVSPETIAQNQVQQAENFELNLLEGSIKTVSGLMPVYDASTAGLTSMETVFFISVSALLYVSVGKLYYCDMNTSTLLGSLSGSGRACYCRFGTYILVASGGILQYYDTVAKTFATITGGLLADFVFFRAGRAVIASSTSDNLYYSCVGDATSSTAWVNVANTSSSMQFLEVGYKDGETIVAVAPLAYDLIVFKTNGRAYRIENEVPNWVIVEASRNAYCTGFFGAVQVMNDVYFMGSRGLMSLVNVMLYSQVEQNNPGQLINHFLQYNSDSSSMIWYLPVLQQIWISSENSGLVFVYNMLTKSFSSRKMSARPSDVVYYDNNVYVARGTKLFMVRDDVATDDSQNINCYLKTKVFLANHHYIVKRIVCTVDNTVFGNATLTLADPTRTQNVSMTLGTGAASASAYSDTNYAYSDTSNVYVDDTTDTSINCNYIAKSFDILIAVTSGAIALRKIQITLAEVGG